MFTHRDVFDETHLPQQMPGRAPELRKISDALRPVTRGEPAESCWEIGPSGAGKTSSARFLLKELEQSWGVTTAKVECVGSTRWELVSEIAAEHPRVLQHRGRGTEELLNALRKNTEEPMIVILDEFDGLEHRDLLVDLVDIDLLSLICIAHDREEAFDQVPDAADCLRFARVVEFDPYDADALVKILEARREEGLRRDAVDDEQLERIAEEVGGSARYAVQALRSAVELGEEHGHTEVKLEDVEGCFEHAKERIREQLLESLARKHHEVYRVIRQADGLRPGELYERYKKTVEAPKTRQAVVKYRKKLARYELIEETATGWVAVDETLAAPLRETRMA